MWEKEKLLVTSNFSFSHIVFKRLVKKKKKNPQGLFGKGLNSGITKASYKMINRFFSMNKTKSRVDDLAKSKTVEDDI